MKRPPRRLILKVIALLAAGAAVNVAVAWGLAMWSGRFATVWIDPSESPATPSYVRTFVWEIHEVHNASYSMSGADVFSGHTALGFDIYNLRTFGPGRTDVHLQTSALVVGLPMPSLGASYTYYSEQDETPLFEEHESGIVLSRPDQNGWWIPGLPLWPGFAVNTLFYAAVLWVLFAIPGALRRTIRRRRGQCPACGYPIGTNERCTECGAAVTGVSIDLQSDTAPQVPRSAKP